MKDEEITRLVRGIAAWEAATLEDGDGFGEEVISALRQLQAENKALKEDKRRLDAIDGHFFDVQYNVVGESNEAVLLCEVSNPRGEQAEHFDIRRAIDAALQQEDK